LSTEKVGDADYEEGTLPRNLEGFHALLEEADADLKS
jgi:hypothetical protein